MRKDEGGRERTGIEMIGQGGRNHKANGRERGWWSGGWEGGREKGDREERYATRAVIENCRDATKLADPPGVFSVRSAIAGSPARHTTKESALRSAIKDATCQGANDSCLSDRESRSRTGASEQDERLRETCARAPTYYRDLRSVCYNSRSLHGARVYSPLHAGKKETRTRTST